MAHLPSSDIAVTYLSETSRIDVNLAAPKLLAALFGAAGADPAFCREIERKIELVRGPTRQRPRTSSSESGSPSQTTNPASTLVRTEQIVDSWGVPEPLYRGIQPALTVASKNAKVDPLLADRLVLTALMQGDEARAQDFLERRRHGFASNDEILAQLPTTTRPYAGFSPSRAVRAIAKVTIASRLVRKYEFVMTAADGANAETRILSWQPLAL